MNEELAGGAPMGAGGTTPAAPRTLTADKQQVSPEEQASYERFVGQGFSLVYDPKMFPKVLDLLEGEGDPIEGLARAAAMVISRVIGSAKEAGVDLGGDVVFHGATEIFEDLAELSKRANIKDFAADPDSLEGAYFRALDQLRIVLEGSGDLNQEAAQADLAMLQQMDEAGELEGFFRSLAGEESAGAAPPPEPADAAPSANEPPRPSRGLMPQGMN